MDRLEKAPKEVVSPELQKVFFFFWQFPIILKEWQVLHFSLK